MVGKSFMVASLALVVSLVGAAQGALVNGGFDVGAAGIFPSGWTTWHGGFGGGSDQKQRNTATFIFNPTPVVHDGVNSFGEGTSGGAGINGIFQIVTVTPNVPITFSGWWAGGDTNNLTFHEVGVFNGTKTAAQLDAAGGDLAVFSKSNVGGGGWNWEFFTKSITPTASTVTVYTKLGATNGGTYANWFDTLQLTPEPASVLLLGCGALVIRRRRLA